MGAIIVANCISVGLEASYGAQNVDVPLLRALETTFLMLYTIELAAR